MLDITIGYPGVTRGGYAQEWYGLTSVFIKGVAPPTINMHLRMVDLQADVIPGVTDASKDATLKADVEDPPASDTTPLLDQRNQEGERITAGPPHPTRVPGIASEHEAQAFNGWLRRRWSDKEALLDRFTTTGGFAVPPRAEDGQVVVDEVQKRGLVHGTPVVIPIGLW